MSKLAQVHQARKLRKLKKVPPRRYTNPDSPVYVKERDKARDAGVVLNSGDGDRDGHFGDGNEKKWGKEKTKRQKGGKKGKIEISAPRPVRKSGEGYVDQRRRSFLEGARVLGMEGLGVVSVLGEGSRGSVDTVPDAGEKGTRGLNCKRDMRDLGGHPDGLKAHPVEGGFGPPSRPPTRRHSERQTIPNRTRVNFVETSVGPPPPHTQTQRQTRPRSNTQPVHDAPKVRSLDSSVSPPPPPPTRTSSKSHNQNITSSLRTNQIQGIRPHHLIRTQPNHPTVNKLLTLCSTETFSVLPPPASAHDSHRSVSSSLGGSSGGGSQNGSNPKRQSIPGSLKANPLKKVYTPPINPSPTLTPTLHPHPAASKHHGLPDFSKLKQVDINKPTDLPRLPSSQPPAETPRSKPVQYFSTHQRTAQPNFNPPCQSSRITSQQAKQQSIANTHTPPNPRTKSPAPQRIPRGSNSSVESVYHTPPTSIRSSRSEISVAGLAHGVKVRDGRRDFLRAEQDDKQDQKPKVQNSWPEVPTRPPPAPPTNGVSRSSSRGSVSTPSVLMSGSGPKSQQNLRTSESREVTTQASPAETEISATPQIILDATTPPAAKEIMPPKPTRHFPLVNQPKSTNLSSPTTNSQSSSPRQYPSTAPSSRPSSSPEPVHKPDQKPKILSGHVKQKVQKLEEKYTLTDAFKEGVKHGRSLGFSEGYQAGIRAVRVAAKLGEEVLGGMGDGGC